MTGSDGDEAVVSVFFDLIIYNQQCGNRLNLGRKSTLFVDLVTGFCSVALGTLEDNPLVFFAFVSCCKLWVLDCCNLRVSTCSKMFYNMVCW